MHVNLKNGLKKPTMLIRADAGPENGVGHVMRCIALGQYWLDFEGVVIFAGDIQSPLILDRLASEGFHYEAIRNGGKTAGDASRIAEVIQRFGVVWVVADGYLYSEDYLQAMTPTGGHMLILDDHQHLSYYPADLILNQNYGSESRVYPSKKGCRILAGSDYALIRKEFLHATPSTSRVPATARHIIVTVGGGAHAKALNKIVTAITSIESPSFKVTIVIGPNAGNQPLLRNGSRSIGNKTVFGNHKYIYQICPDMPAVLSEADLAITAAGSTCWELAALGVPFITLTLADNQAPIACSLDSDNIAPSIGRIEAFSKENFSSLIKRIAIDGDQRTRMKLKGRRLIDGRGGLRVARAMLSILSADS